MKLFSSVEAHLILMSASLLAGVGATPLPLSLSANTAAVSRALEPRQFRAPAPHEAINFNYVRDTHATDPSYPVVVSGRGFPENTSPGLTSRSFDSLITRGSNIPMTRRADSDESPVVKFGRSKPPRPSLAALGNPIQKVFTTELAKEQYKAENPSLAIRMMHVDLLFALTEEKDFEDSDVATLEQQIEKDRTEFAKFVETERDGNLAKACLRRLSYYKAVLGNKDRVVITPPPPIPGHANVDKDEYTKFVQSTIEIKLPNRRSLADRITYVGLNYIQAKLERSLDVSFEVKWFEVFVKEFDGGGDEEKECQARAKYYKELIQQLTDKVV